MAAGEFHKMHGLGNDFVIIDGRENSLAMTAARAKAISDRKIGIGCDQLIMIEPSAVADIRMRIFNQDGSEVEACGNATRCVVALLGKDTRIKTAGGLVAGRFGAHTVTLDMPEPKFDWQDIPLAFAMDSAAMPLAWDELAAPMAVNVGNPHAIFFVEDADAVELQRLGPLIENDSVFSERVNVNIASIHDGTIKLRVWERGVGETRACGTGACATAVAAIRQGKVSSPVNVHLKGGTLEIAWQPGSGIVMTGGTTYVFRGETDWDRFG